MQTVPIAFSGSIPVYYDQYLGPLFFEPFSVTVADAIRVYAPASVLELASGTGRLTKRLPGVLPAGAKVIASDINPAMIEFGKRQTADLDISWQQIDAVDLPFESNTFDLIVVQFGVMFYSDKVRAYQEALRVLKPGGRMLFTCWDRLSENPVPELVNQVLQEYFPVDTPAFYTVPFHYHQEEQIVEDLEAAGFRNIRIELLKHTGTSESAGAAAKGTIEGTPTITAIEERDGEAADWILKQLTRRMEARFGSGRIEVPLQARLVSCMKVPPIGG